MPLIAYAHSAGRAVPHCTVANPPPLAALRSPACLSPTRPTALACSRRPTMLAAVNPVPATPLQLAPAFAAGLGVLTIGRVAENVVSAIRLNEAAPAQLPDKLVNMVRAIYSVGAAGRCCAMQTCMRSMCAVPCRPRRSPGTQQPPTARITPSLSWHARCRAATRGSRWWRASWSWPTWGPSTARTSMTRASSPTAAGAGGCTARGGQGAACPWVAGGLGQLRQAEASSSHAALGD